MARTEAILTRELLKGIPWESEFEGRKTEEMENCYFPFPPSDQGWTLCLERSLQRINLWYCEHPRSRKAISASRRRGNEESLRCWRWSDGKANLQIFVPSILVLSGSNRDGCKMSKFVLLQVGKSSTNQPFLRILLVLGNLPQIGTFPQRHTRPCIASYPLPASQATNSDAPRRISNLDHKGSHSPPRLCCC